ncbi:N-acetylmuramic acid 6-phosphate etherase [Geomicrobium sp. JSM 1781026]|uniref:N-acetylmuramic acid 6-phosphate etherase n=1 Tax=Geomicrobium sp. JSM 1781026 TaxID=3344580 RepID=UPI0035C230B5
MRNDFLNLVTEQRNAKSTQIDQMSTEEIVALINEEDQTISAAVRSVLPAIEEAVGLLVKSIQSGGRVFYLGAGSSGRLGFLDASECPPTFGVDRSLFQVVLAGGESAMSEAIEGAEDEKLQGHLDLKERQVTANDVVVGISASGRTPYVIGALDYANQLGASTIAISSNHNAKISQYSDCQIEVVVGPEVITGSTRMKAGTAHKMILNMLSSTTMIKLGKVYENLMIDVNVSNKKLEERAISILQRVSGCNEQQARHALLASDKSVKTALVVLKTGVTVEEAKRALGESEGGVQQAIHNCTSRG